MARPRRPRNPPSKQRLRNSARHAGEGLAPPGNVGAATRARTGPDAARKSAGPLSDLRVLDLTDDHAGALTTMFLADYGADVVKVTPPEGNAFETGPQFLVWNRNKRSISVDFQSGARREQAGAALEGDFKIVRALLDSADVLVESLGPGGAERLGLDHAAVSDSNPGLVFCSITPYGDSGPLSGNTGYEALVQAVAGVMTEQRGRDGSPVYNALPLCGIGTALLAIHGILAALHHRRVTGRGQRVVTSLYQGAIAARAPMLVRGEGVQTWDSAGNDPQGALPNYRLYRCSDGKWLHLGTLIPVFWNKMIIALDLFEFATDPRFETAPLYWPTEEIRAEAKRILAEKFATAPRDHWLKVLRAGDVPASPATPTYELFEHPQVLVNGLVTAIEDPRAGRLEQGMPPVAMSITPGSVRRPAPAKAQSSITWESEERFFGTGDIFEAPTPRGPVLSLSKGRGREGGEGREAPRGPLAGLRVLDLSSYLAGPIGPACLADLGADVIKVEPLAGEGCRMIMMLFLGGNVSKRDLAIDLKHPGSKEVLRRLIESSDVIVHNNRVGVAERLGIDYETVRSIRPDAIYLQSTAYGSQGPDAALPGFDPLFQTFTGIGIAQAGPGNPPVFPKTPICDIATAMLGAAAVLLALAHRDRTGEGQLVETSLLATGLWLKSDWFMRYPGSEPVQVTNADNSGLSPLCRWYRTSDGYLFVACRKAGEVEAFFGLLGIDDQSPLAADEGPLTMLIASRMAGTPSADWLRQLRAAGVPAERVAENNEDGVYKNPQATHLRAIEYHPYPGFTNLRQPGILLGFSGTPARRRSGPPTCGQDTVEVLTEIGYAQSEIDALERERVVAVYRGQ